MPEIHVGSVILNDALEVEYVVDELRELREHGHYSHPVFMLRPPGSKGSIAYYVEDVQTAIRCESWRLGDFNLPHPPTWRHAFCINCNDERWFVENDYLCRECRARS